MKRGLLTLCAVLSIASVTGCGGDDAAESSPSATVGTAPTSTTLSTEAEVEAAYLRSWDVYADAVLTFDTSKLEDVYTGEALQLRLDEVAGLKEANTPARTIVSHDLRVELVRDGEAIVHDDYENHSVLLDGTTDEPIEPDPNETVRRQYKMRLTDGLWKIWFVVAL